MYIMCVFKYSVRFQYYSVGILTEHCSVHCALSAPTTIFPIYMCYSIRIQCKFITSMCVWKKKNSVYIYTKKYILDNLSSTSATHP